KLEHRRWLLLLVKQASLLAIYLSALLPLLPSSPISPYPTLFRSGLSCAAPARLHRAGPQPAICAWRPRRNRARGRAGSGPVQFRAGVAFATLADDPRGLPAKRAAFYQRRGGDSAV